MIWLSNLLRLFLQTEQSPIVRKPYLEPVEYAKGSVKFNMETLERLSDIKTRAAYHREQMEALAEECCELLSCDTNKDELDCEFAREIVYAGRDIGGAMDAIIDYRSLRENTA